MVFGTFSFHGFIYYEKLSLYKVQKGRAQKGKNLYSSKTKKTGFY